MSELLYPIIAGYDSVAVEADVELAGPTSSTTSSWVGRSSRSTRRSRRWRSPSSCSFPGTRSSLSQSKGNYIGLAEAPWSSSAKPRGFPTRSSVSGTGS